MKINKLLLGFMLAGFSQYCQAQLFTVASGTTMQVEPGTLFTVEGLSLTPTASFQLTNCSLSKTTVVANALNTTYIQRVYAFMGTAPVFSGTVQINYNEGSELNGIAETSLQLYAYNSGSWGGYTGSNNIAGNSVSSNSLTGVSLSELTLGSALGPLPVQLLDFSVQKLNKQALLLWRTAQEQNSKDFLVQHSADGFTWLPVGTVAAAGNSASIRNYSFIHPAPVTGNNYYRLQQRDLDDKATYSPVQRLVFGDAANGLLVINNPVRNNLLQVQLSKPGFLSMFNQQGQLLFSKQVAAGMQTVDVGRYAAGIYYVRSGDKTIKILIE